MGNSERKPPAAGKGRPKGSPNKTTALLKDAVLEAAERAGDKEGMVGYLEKQARDNPTAFLTLLGKVLPAQVDANVAVTTDPLRELVDYVSNHGKRIIDVG
ncbi:MAG: hypothetical protein MnENMB40S_28890 [Rhizobiaceae bacterium MnEN-MB40S]|nr:MAG: hypothetical protein MnENMB40S_28890 [Rhizobiaceae bacterium MnEN-MB40S]